QEPALQQLGVEPVGLRPSMFPRYCDTRGMDHMRLHPTRTQPARQPEASRPASKASAIRVIFLPALTASSRQRCSRPRSLSALGSSFFCGWRSMPGSTPATSQLDWLSSTTAMIVLSWSKATRDLLKSFSWGIGALRQLFASDDGAISSPPAPYHLSAGGRWIRTSGSARESIFRERSGVPLRDREGLL